VDYFFVKGVMESLFSALGLTLPELKESSSPFTQYGSAAEIPAGLFGALNPDIQRNYDFKKPVFVFDLDLDRLLVQSGRERHYKQLPKFPYVTRDISLTMPDDAANQNVISLVKELGSGLVEAIFPFDKYKESVAYRIIYRHPERTLTEEEVNQKHQLIVDALVSRLHVKLR
ncbi:MAG: hypothetical protein WC500_04680, partial [Candidatus Margulisiibacteriota bacterium]